VVELGEELVLSSPIRPKQKMLQTMPVAPQPQGEQMPDFGNAERNLLERSFFLPGTKYGQYCQGQHGQSDMPIPALPVPDFVVVQPTLAFGHLESDFNGPALSLSELNVVVSELFVVLALHARD
jgi:hypothetical protein